MTHTALIAVDYINDIVHADGKIPSCAAHLATQKGIQNLNNAIAHARKKGWPIIFVRVGFSHDYAQHTRVSPIFKKAKEFGALEIGKWGTEIHAEIQKKESDPVIIKHRINPFYGTNLEVTLKSKNIDTIVVAGVSTEWAIQSIIRDAHDKDYNIYLLEDCCASHSPESHTNSITTLSRIAKVIKTSELESIAELNE